MWTFETRISMTLKGITIKDSSAYIKECYMSISQSIDGNIENKTAPKSFL